MWRGYFRGLMSWLRPNMYVFIISRLSEKERERLVDNGARLYGTEMATSVPLLPLLPSATGWWYQVQYVAANIDQLNRRALGSSVSLTNLRNICPRDGTGIDLAETWNGYTSALHLASVKRLRTVGKFDAGSVSWGNFLPTTTPPPLVFDHRFFRPDMLSIGKLLWLVVIYRQGRETFRAWDISNGSLVYDICNHCKWVLRVFAM